jgi:hypothetical protein
MGSDAMTGPLRVNHPTIAAVRARRLDADQAAQLADMLTLAFNEPKDAATALGLQLTKVEVALVKPAYEAILREAAASLPPRMLGKSQRISVAFLQYRKGGWQHDCNLEECPPRLRGLEIFAWRALRLFDSAIGLSARNIRRKLAAHKCDGQLDDL